MRWPIEWRGTGAHAHADGSHDVRAFQRWVLSGRLRVRQSLVMRAAVAGSVLRFDGAGNPAICKVKQNARIDVLSAGVIACGLADIHCPPGVALCRGRLMPGHPGSKLHAALDRRRWQWVRR